MIFKRGLMLVLSSPSGAGKTSIAKKILSNEKITLSISTTTRKKRKNEVDGKDYFFTSKENFIKLVKKNYFLEHANVFNNFYGTPAHYVEKTLNEGKDILFDIDWQGTLQLKESKKDDLVTIFVLPPSKNELQRRLISRGQDDEREIQKRINGSSKEMSHYSEYDYIIINDNLEKSVKNVQMILKAERLKRKRFNDLASFVKSLQLKEI